ncbi:MAG: N-acetylmuramic acid 6-phosphate etherase [Pseudomonadota bacterium]
MSLRTTELRHHQSGDIDMLASSEAASILLSGQVDAVRSVFGAIPAITQAASLLAKRFQQGGNLIYCAAGSSGLMALADGLELPGTFGIPNTRIKILFAGGDACLKNLLGGPEDDENLAIQDIAAADLSADDTVIALSASGLTPYALKAVELAKNAGAKSVAIANNEGAPLFKDADVAICLPTPPEVIAGSTRMGAGSAQKVALNMISTLMAIELGHVHDGHMVNVVADNEKLKQRAHGIVMQISACSKQTAHDALDLCGGHVKPAVLIASGAENPEAAKILLERNGQKLRPSLSELKQSQGSKLKNA